LASILVVEDDFEIAGAIADLLTEAGHMPRTARNGAEGLRLVADESPDLILLDVEMPVLDGPGMAKALAIQRAGERPIPIILISAARDLRSIAGAVGTLHYLKKPFSLNGLLQIVSNVLDARSHDAT
jgi:DNA-binding response OmpR family regulator